MGHHRYRTFPSWRKVLLSVKVLFQSVLTDKHWDPGHHLPFTGSEEVPHSVILLWSQLTKPSWDLLCPERLAYTNSPAGPQAEAFWLHGKALPASSVVPYGQPEVCLAKVAISQSRAPRESQPQWVLPTEVEVKPRQSNYFKLQEYGKQIPFYQHNFVLK